MCAPTPGSDTQVRPHEEGIETTECVTSRNGLAEEMLRATLQRAIIELPDIQQSGVSASVVWVTISAGVLIGFETEEDWFDYRLEHHPEFLQRVAEARAAFRTGHGTRLEDLPT